MVEKRKIRVQTNLEASGRERKQDMQGGECSMREKQKDKKKKPPGRGESQLDALKTPQEVENALVLAHVLRCDDGAARGVHLSKQTHILVPVKADTHTSTCQSRHTHTSTCQSRHTH